MLPILTRGDSICRKPEKNIAATRKGNLGVKEGRMSFGFCRNLLQLVSDYKDFLR